MQRKHSSDRNLEDITDAEVRLAIRYLEPDEEVSRDSDKSTNSKLAVRIVFLLLGCIALIWFYLWSH
jgi:hypothetical protein